MKVVPRIIDARVIFSLDHASDYTKVSPNKTASVATIYRPTDDYPQSPLSDLEIRELVSAGIMGLDANDVIVVQKPLQSVSFIGADDETLAFTVNVLKTDNKPQPNTLWAMMALTLFALVLAAYGLLRIFIGRRQSA